MCGQHGAHAGVADTAGRKAALSVAEDGCAWGQQQRRGAAARRQPRQPRETLPDWGKGTGLCPVSNCSEQSREQEGPSPL